MRRKKKPKGKRGGAAQAAKLPAQKEAKARFSVYKDPSVEERLHELFHGKCAYCESFYYSTAPVDTEHFRPKGRLQEDKNHGGYWWLAAAWDNLLPSCINCNRRSGQITPTLTAQLVQLVKDGSRFSASSEEQSGKHDSFPILGTRATESARDFSSEYPLLLDPCRDNPSEHLRFYIDRDNLIGLVLPKSRDDAGLPAGDVKGAKEKLEAEIKQARNGKLSVKGAVSIQTYGLNRLGLVQDRTRVLRHLMYLEWMVIELSSLMEEVTTGKNGTKPKSLKIINRLKVLRDRSLLQMKEMGNPQEPYSVMVQEWTADFLVRIKSSLVS
ncbi:endonuclease [Pseudomonas poae]|nr:endonuclease [Pseudomonas poae]